SPTQLSALSLHDALPISGLSEPVIGEVRRFLADWTKRIGAKYLMVSLPPDFDFPEQSNCARLLEKAVLPHCRESGLPFAVMLGVDRKSTRLNSSHVKISY